MTHLIRSRRHAARPLLIAASLTLLPLSAWAQETPPTAPAAAPAAQPTAKVDADAKKLVQDMVTAHQALTSFSAVMEGKATRNGQEQTVKSTFSYAKPNKVSVVTVAPGENGKSFNHTVVADGKYVYTFDSAVPTEYQRLEADTKTFNLGAVLGNAGASISSLLSSILASPDFKAKVLDKNVQSVQFTPDETIGGVETRVVKVEMGEPVLTISFAIGKSDTLLRRVSFMVNGQTVLNETYSDVKVNPTLGAEAFTFTPPAGTKLSDAPPKTAQAESAPYDPRLKVGAVPLPLSGTDTAGKPVSLASYKGKVVLVDFWATWCGPCVQEVPNVVAAYKKYHGQGFEVLGISLDQPTDGAKLASFTKTHAMPWRQVHDKQGAIANGYKVQFIPFTLLIGRDGKIAALGARGDELDKAVAAAIKQK